MLIVAPTRELASQIGEDIRSLARFTRIKVATVFGGVSLNTQIAALRGRPQIVVACPGRLLDLLDRRAPEHALCRARLPIRPQTRAPILSRAPEAIPTRGRA